MCSHGVNIGSLLVLLRGARATYPLAGNLADAFLRLIESSPSSAAVPLVQDKGNTTETPLSISGPSPPASPALSVHDEPHLTLTGIARVRLTDPPQGVNGPLPLPRLDVDHLHPMLTRPRPQTSSRTSRWPPSDS